MRLTLPGLESMGNIAKASPRNKWVTGLAPLASYQGHWRPRADKPLFGELLWGTKVIRS